MPGPPDGLQYDAPASNNLQCIKPTLRHRWDEGISQMTPYETIREKSEVRVCCRCGRQGGWRGMCGFQETEKEITEKI